MSRFTFSQRPRTSLWLLGLLGCLLNAAIVYLAISLYGSSTTVAVEARRRIDVPYENEPELWEPWRRWVVQEDGRNKPFDTFCRESVRAITGRERFEESRSMTTGRVLSPGHDPVAIVASWLMPADLARPSRNQNSLSPWGRGAGVKGPQEPSTTLLTPDSSPPRGEGREFADWEHYPFILCRNGELRQLLYEARQPGVALTSEQRFGQHVEPAALRGSPALLQLLRQALQKRENDSRAPLQPVEREALDVQGRLELYDRVCRGGEIEDGSGRPRLPGEFQIIALDQVSPAWFSLASLRALAAPDGQELWERILERRRLENPDLYEGSSPQPLPAAEIRQGLAAYAALREAYGSGNSDNLAAAAQEFIATVERVNGQFNYYSDTDVTQRELWYNRVNPFRKAWLFDLVATLLFTIGLVLGARWRWAGRIYYWAGLLAAACCLGWAVTGFICRVTIAGRPPVSNMYESVIWVAFMALVFGLLLEAIYRRGVIALAAALVSTLGFVLADQLPLTFSPSLQPLQAVLRSNYWLVVHVLPMVSSYAPFAVAWGLGNLNLGLILFAPSRRNLIHTLSLFCYRAIQIGVLLLFLGTMLGGFWAAESWGRFWGWDPKEVWALIALLCYVIPLHGRYVGWVGDFGLSVAAVVCFASVVMAWYGVNFVLGAGLHSYGFGSSDDRWIYLAGLINISLVVHGAWRHGARQFHF